MKKRSTANLALDTAHYGGEIIEMMNNAQHCLNCGARLRYLPNKENRRNRGYCSMACYNACPPKMAYISLMSGKPAREAILDKLNACASHNVAAGLLGIGKPQLYAYMKKLGIKKVLRYE